MWGWFLRDKFAYQGGFRVLWLSRITWMIFELFMLSHNHNVQRHRNELRAASSLYILSHRCNNGTLLKWVVHMCLLHNGRIEHNVAKNRSILSKSVSQDGSKMSPIRGWFNQVEIMGRQSEAAPQCLFLSACSHFFFCPHVATWPDDLHVILPLYQRQLKGAATVEP